MITNYTLTYMQTLTILYANFDNQVQFIYKGYIIYNTDKMTR